METLKENIAAIHERNRRVELEKAWEVSVARRAFLTVLTYGTAALLLWLLGEERYLLLAGIPAVSYIFSTLSLPWIKRWWITTTSRNLQD